MFLFFNNHLASITFTIYEFLYVQNLLISGIFIYFQKGRGNGRNNDWYKMSSLSLEAVSQVNDELRCNDVVPTSNISKTVEKQLKKLDPTKRDFLGRCPIKIVPFLNYSILAVQCQCEGSTCSSIDSYCSPIEKDININDLVYKVPIDCVCVKRPGNPGKPMPSPKKP